jgi:hypothetical protein
MKAKLVYESVHFQRGQDPLEPMKIGRTKRRQNEKYLREISEIVGTDISKEMNRILDILDEDGITITGVDPEYEENPEGRGRSRMWVLWNDGRENRGGGGEEFSFVQFPKPIPRKWFNKFGKSVWDQNDPYASGHNAQVITRILQEMIWQKRTEWPGQKEDWTKEQYEDFRKELSFLKGK